MTLPDSFRRMRREHTMMKDKEMCVHCHGWWPCDTSKALDALEKLHDLSWAIYHGTGVVHGDMPTYNQLGAVHNAWLAVAAQEQEGN